MTGLTPAEAGELWRYKRAAALGIPLADAHTDPRVRVPEGRPKPALQPSGEPGERRYTDAGQEGVAAAVAAARNQYTYPATPAPEPVVADGHRPRLIPGEASPDYSPPLDAEAIVADIRASQYHYRAR